MHRRGTRVVQPGPQQVVSVPCACLAPLGRAVVPADQTSRPLPMALALLAHGHNLYSAWYSFGTQGAVRSSLYFFLKQLSNVLGAVGDGPSSPQLLHLGAASWVQRLSGPVLACGCEGLSSGVRLAVSGALWLCAGDVLTPEPWVPSSSFEHLSSVLPGCCHSVTSGPTVQCLKTTDVCHLAQCLRQPCPEASAGPWSPGGWTRAGRTPNHLGVMSRGRGPNCSHSREVGVTGPAGGLAPTALLFLSSKLPSLRTKRELDFALNYSGRAEKGDICLAHVMGQGGDPGSPRGSLFPYFSKSQGSPWGVPSFCVWSPH